MLEQNLFTKNLLDLIAKNNFNAKTLSEQINKKAGMKIIDHSYIAKIVKNAKENDIGANPSLNKAVAIASGFGLNLIDMLAAHQDNKNIDSFDDAALEAAFRHTEIFSDSMGLKNSDFKAKVFKIQYWIIVSGNTGEGSALLAKLANKYST
tara:strand:+ start:336 stop:788 length:453 start_codon:yes stop_codon:yes gene_type:complete